MDFLNEIRTQFVQSRLTETKWENRSYIRDLWHLERFILNGGPNSAHTAMFFKALRDKYPVEYDCIKKNSKQER